MDDGSVRVDVKSDSDGRGLTASIWNEDHTIGNALRFALTKNPAVELAAYTMPHPAEPKINVRVQLHGAALAEGKTATDVLREGISDVQGMMEHILDVFNKRIDEYSEPLEEQD